MNDEIKKILEHIKLYPEKIYCLSEKEKIIILDYITNLQKENQKNKKIIEDVYNYLDEKKDVPEWWDTDFFTCMNILRDGKLTFDDWIKKGDDENEER